MPWWWEWWQPRPSCRSGPAGRDRRGWSSAAAMAACRPRSSWRGPGVDVHGAGARRFRRRRLDPATAVRCPAARPWARASPARAVNDGEAEALAERLLSEAADSLTQVETVIKRESIECHWRCSGRFTGAYTPRHYDEQAAKVGSTTGSAGRAPHGAASEQQREEIDSDYLLRRHGGGAHRASSTRRSTTAAC